MNHKDAFCRLYLPFALPYSPTMTSLRTLAAAAACALFLSACSATIAPPYGNDRPMPTSKSQMSKSSKSRSSKAKKSTSTTTKKKATSSRAAWEGSCEPQGTCDRVSRSCEAEGTLCVFADAGPIGSCLTIEQRKNCPSAEVTE